MGEKGDCSSSIGWARKEIGSGSSERWSVVGEQAGGRARVYQ